MSPHLFFKKKKNRFRLTRDGFWWCLPFYRRTIFLFYEKRGWPLNELVTWPSCMTRGQNTKESFCPTSFFFVRKGFLSLAMGAGMITRHGSSPIVSSSCFLSCKRPHWNEWFPRPLWGRSEVRDLLLKRKVYWGAVSGQLQTLLRLHQEVRWPLGQLLHVCFFHSLFVIHVKNLFPCRFTFGFATGS